MSNVPVITVDGPSGTGKGIICSYLADWLQWHFLDSGALYRVLALAAEKHHINSDEEAKLVNLAENLNVEFEVAGAGSLVNVLLDGEVATDDIRTETCGNAASVIAPIAKVRKALLSRQRAFHEPPGLIADGRDMGTEVFPAAELKIYLTASVEERASRRHKELLEKGEDVSLPALVEQVRARDERDMNRDASPLRPADEAIELDTSSMSISEVTDTVLNILTVKGIK